MFSSILQYTWIDQFKLYHPNILHTMYITNINHFLDENGNIAAGMNDSGRKMASFLAMIIDHSTSQQEEEMTDIDIRCNKRGCRGSILAEVNRPENTILGLY